MTLRTRPELRDDDPAASPAGAQIIGSVRIGHIKNAFGLEGPPDRCIYMSETRSPVRKCV